MENTKEYWNRRAEGFRQKKDNDEYVAGILAFLQAREDDSIFDMGCGSGVLAIPLALLGHKVIAADFSDKMLECLTQEARRENCGDRITPVLLDWNEDWAARSLETCDLAIASRSLPAGNEAGYIRKLETVAKRSAVIAMWPLQEYGEDLTADRKIILELERMGRKPAAMEMECTTERMLAKGIATITLIRWTPNEKKE